MRKNILATICSVTVVAIIIGALINGGVHAMNVQFNVKDLPEHGLRIISPANPAFKGMVASYFHNKPSATDEALAPFSVFIKNTSNQHVIAYVLKWDLVKADGKVISHITSYAAPGVLMGNGLSDISLPNSTKHIIKPGSLQYLSWVSSAGEETSGSSMSATGGSADTSTAEQVQRAMQDRDRDRLLNQLSIELSKATDLSVTIDGAFFEDGTFVGPNSTKYFEQMQAQVAAKLDLYNEVTAATEQRRSLDAVFASVEAKSDSPDITINADTTPDQLYTFYTKLFAQEIKGMKNAYGKERTAAYIADLNKKPRPKLQKK